MLSASLKQQIKDYVYTQPRTIQEIALYIDKNWRTAEGYVQKIIDEDGSLALKEVRKGSKSNLKLIYWINTDKPHLNQAQERLSQEIETGRRIYDFSPFDIYQYVDENKRHSFFENQNTEKLTIKQNLIGELLSAQQEILIFSGDFSWINTKQQGKHFEDVFLELMEEGISIKVICNVSMESLENIQKTLALNERVGKDLIEIRHCRQPLRAVIIDDRIVKLRENKNITDALSNKKVRTFIFYEILDSEWILWMKRLFFKFYRRSIDAKKRISDLKSMKMV